MNRLCLVLSILLTGACTACSLGNVAPGPQQQTPYAIVSGHIGAPKITFNIAVYVSAYDDSAHAVARGTAGIKGASQASVDTANDYLTSVMVSEPGTYFVDVLATGQGQMGFVSSLDTIRAVRVRFDSVGGATGPGSIAVDDTLP